MDPADRKSLTKLAIVVAIVAVSVLGLAKGADILAALKIADAIEEHVDEPAPAPLEAPKPDLGSGDSGSTSTGA